MKIDLTAARRVLGEFRIAPPAALDPEVYRRVREYKEKIAARYIPIGEQDVERLPGRLFYISRKMDGEHNHLYYADGQAALIKPGGSTLHGLPVLDEAARVLGAAGVRSCIIPGELIVEKPDGSRTRIYDVINLLTHPGSQADLARFNFAPFDILEIDGEKPDDYEETCARLNRLFAGSRIRPVETIISGDRDVILRTYETWVKRQGDEGLMIRSDLPFRYKFKAAHRFDAVVVGYREYQGAVSGLLLALVDPSGFFQILGTVNEGLEGAVADELARRLAGLEINSEYIHVDQYQISYRMVRPLVVVEINSDDILTRHVDGRPYRKMLLEYVDEEYRTYRPLRSVPFVGLQRNSFVRFRDDKSVNPSDLRVSQVSDLVVIESEKTVDFRRATLPPARVLLREVYTRDDAKSGAPAVRKIVAWQTNKQAVDPAYSAYVVHYTDYSPARAQPLQTGLCLTDDPAQVAELAAAFRERCALKGWKLISESLPATAPAGTEGARAPGRTKAKSAKSGQTASPGKEKSPAAPQKGGLRPAAGKPAAKKIVRSAKKRKRS